MFRFVYTALLLLGLAACSQDDNRPVMPPQGFKADTSIGKELYLQHCAQCHGRGMQGSKQGPPLLHKIYHPNHHADLAFYLASRNGVTQHHWQFGNMPKMPVITAEKMGHIIAYIRMEQRKAGLF